jgi:hypothetical protein
VGKAAAESDGNILSPALFKLYHIDRFLDTPDFSIR